MFLKKLIIITIIFSFVAESYGQSVGLVLSGGGAKGFAHVGVIQALEDNNIPIDYIAGTSIGAMIGGLYAIGYSPSEMAELLRSDEFLRWSYGQIDNKDEYYYKLKNESPSWAELPLEKVDGIFSPKLPTSLISPEQMDLRFMQFFEPAGSGAKYDFNNLLVPFFCIATDVHKKKAVILDQGNLSAAIRASMTFPGYFKPIEIDSVLLLDGGMENNFPTEIMIEKFNPGLLIGSKVATNPKKPDADDLYKQLENVFMKSTNYEMPENAVLIEPNVEEFGYFDLEDFDTLYARGYRSPIEKIEDIKSKISIQIEPKQVNQKRNVFKKNNKEINIENIFITGVNQETVEYILKNIRKNRSIITFQEFEQEYFKLLSDNLIVSVYPKIIYNEGSGYFDLYLDIKTKKEFTISLGGNISTNLRNMGFVGIDYIFQKKNVYNLSSNIIIGQFYNSISGKFRMDFPPQSAHGTRVSSPYYIDISATGNQWNYFQITTDWFVDSESPSKVEQEEVHFQTNFGRPIKNRGLIYTGFSFGQTHDLYYHTNMIERNDIPDETIFDYSSVHLTYEYSTLNYKEYANKGKYLRIQGRYITGLESYFPGTTSGTENPQPYKDGHSWYHIQGSYTRFFESSKHFTLGMHANINYSNKNTFNNSMATFLESYAFSPFPQSRLVLLENFRANTYVGAGIIPIVLLNPSLSIRAESYVFQPYQYIDISQYETTLSNPFPSPSITASLAMIYQSPIGPVAFTASYFMNEENPYYFQLNFGYIIFNKRGLD